MKSQNPYFSPTTRGAATPTSVRWRYYPLTGTIILLSIIASVFGADYRRSPATLGIGTFDLEFDLEHGLPITFLRRQPRMQAPVVPWYVVSFGGPVVSFSMRALIVDTLFALAASTVAAFSLHLLLNSSRNVRLIVRFTLVPAAFAVTFVTLFIPPFPGLYLVHWGVTVIAITSLVPVILIRFGRTRTRALHMANSGEP